jgi:hypothetical protein
LNTEGFLEEVTLGWEGGYSHSRPEKALNAETGARSGVLWWV